MTTKGEPKLTHAEWVAAMAELLPDAPPFDPDEAVKELMRERHGEDEPAQS